MATSILFGLLLIAGTNHAAAPAGSSNSKALPAQESDQPDAARLADRTCETGGQVVVGQEYRLYNNKHGEWRLAEGDTYVQCMGHDSSPGATIPIWWDWSLTTDELYVKGFPQIYYGTNPWLQEPTTPNLPARIRDIELLTVLYGMTIDATGLYNVAFDMWVLKDDTPHPSERTHEIMIWLQSTIPPNYPDFVRTFTIGSSDYDLYHKTHSSGYSQMLIVSHDSSINGWTDLRSFFDYLVAEGYLDDSHYLANIALGTEMWDGEGRFDIHGYIVVQR